MTDRPSRGQIGVEVYVRDWMSPDPLTAAPADTLASAVETLESHGLRHLPVLSGGRLAGIISDRDVLRRGEADLASLTVGDIMSTQVHTIGEDAPIEEAARTMLTERISALPVLQGPRLVGILTTTDCLLALLERQ